jgi:flagellar biosynthesis anti-sigma factor FlgM
VTLNSIQDKIGLPDPLAIEPAGKTAPTTGGPGNLQQSAESAAPVTDTTSLSKLGDTLSTAARSAASQSSFRPELVASIKSQIAAGTYNPDPTAVANSIAAALKGMK